MKQILMIATGGTIASKSSENGLKPLITSNELLSYVPDARSFCKADTLQLLNIDSTNMQPKHWLMIAAAIREHYDRYDGFVICHGTDTMAYTAAALSYLIQNSPKPIVVTGARGKKERTKSYNAFSSINFPYIATIQDQHVIFYLDDKALLSEPVHFSERLNDRVALLKLIPSMESGVLDYLAGHYDAVIIESFGVGGLPSYESGDFHKAIKKWIGAGKTVVMTTQVTNEGSNMSIYEVGKTIKQEFGLLEAYDMTLEATVTKLMWILGQTSDPERIREMFYQTINRDILYTAKW